MKGRLFTGLLGLGILAGLITTFRVFTTGFVLYAKTDILVWTLPIAAYIFFSLTSAGLAFVSSIPLVFNIKRYEVIEKRTIFLEIAVLCAGFVCLFLHLGAPLNAVYFLLSPNPASPLWWLAMLYGIYLVVLLASFWKIHTAHASKFLGTLVFLIAIGTSTALGWLLGMTDARPALNPSFLTVYFPVTAFACGLAAIMLFSLASSYFSGAELSGERAALFNEIAKVFGVAIGITLVLFIWRTITGGISSSEVEFTAFRKMMGSFSYQTELWLGLVVPFILMVSPSVRITTWGKVVASTSLLLGMLAGRLELVLTGEILPMGPLAEGLPQFVSYMPTIWEVFVALFGLAVMLLIYTMGDRHLKLETTQEKPEALT
jgi:molybdopterin-containing oxidoreductase family membrane subunit